MPRPDPILMKLRLLSNYFGRVDLGTMPANDELKAKIAQDRRIFREHSPLLARNAIGIRQLTKKTCGNHTFVVDAVTRLGYSLNAQYFVRVRSARG
jgi:hypothetical protein